MAQNYRKKHFTTFSIYFTYYFVLYANTNVFVTKVFTINEALKRVVMKPWLNGRVKVDSRSALEVIADPMMYPKIHFYNILETIIK